MLPADRAVGRPGERGAALLTVLLLVAGIAVMAGAGLTPDNIGAVMRASGADEFHASARTFQPGLGREGPPGLARGYWRTHAEVVRALRRALDATP